MDGYSEINKGDRLRVVWSGREGVMVAFHKHRLAGYRVLLDGESEDWGFNRNELEKLGPGAK